MDLLCSILIFVFAIPKIKSCQHEFLSFGYHMGKIIRKIIWKKLIDFSPYYRNNE